MDTFTQAYIEAALWSSLDDNDEPMDKNYGKSDIAEETLARMERDCASFQAKYEEAIREGGLGDEKAGHDFWLTRKGHGAGFWDGDWPEPWADQLDKGADSYGKFDLYVGDDGEIYGSGGREQNPGNPQHHTSFGPGFRLYSLKDHRHYGGVFDTQEEAESYAIQIGLYQGEYEFRKQSGGGQGSWARNPHSGWEIYNYKTGDTFGRQFPNKEKADEFVRHLQDQSPGLKLFWRSRPIVVPPFPEQRGNPLTTTGGPDRPMMLELLSFLFDGPNAEAKRLRRQVAALAANYDKFQAKGKYDHMKAVKGFRPIADAAAKAYEKEVGGYQEINTTTRNMMAQEMVLWYEDGELEARLEREDLVRNPHGTPEELERGLGSLDSWNLYGSGTSAPRGHENSYDAHLPGGRLQGGTMQYTIDPVATSAGRFRGYSLKVAGHPLSAGLWQDLGLHTTAGKAAKAAQKHYRQTRTVTPGTGGHGRVGNPNTRALGIQRYQQAKEALGGQGEKRMPDGTLIATHGSAVWISKPRGGNIYLGENGIFSAQGTPDWLRKYSPTGRRQDATGMSEDVGMDVPTSGEWGGEPYGNRGRKGY